MASLWNSMNIATTLAAANMIGIGALAWFGSGPTNEQPAAPWISLADYNAAPILERDKFVPVVAVINTVSVVGTVNLDSGTSVDISNLSPIKTEIVGSVKVEPEDWQGLPVRIEK